MDFITSILLESRLQLGLLCFLIFSIMLFWRRRFESETAKRRVLPLTLASFVLLFVIQSLVVTQREKIVRQLDTFIDAVVAEDALTASAIVSAGYDSEDVGRDQFVDSLRDWFELIDVRDARYTSSIEVDGTTARMKLNSTATVSIHKEVGQTHIAVWTIEWRRNGDDWQMIRITPEMVDGIQVKSLGELSGLARQH